ncbi:hypothetical protein [Prauserella endophytica]|uniref:Uncharacterized protein n=1 Tax=Prauserella endophytica TaxID=1592324 RepID=A0ABY2RT71_9PSEU|nr:hypothetical protein [Prauserella endophytica]TKG59621.1 hypothetical protein FCN18_36685 [Prauserella endophytica]
MNKRENQRPPGAADWHARMALRGGPVTHALARAGALLFAFAGALVMLGVVVLYAANPGEEAMDNSVAANVVGGIVVFVPIGAVGLGLIGLAAQYAARSWLRTPTEAERRAARDAEARTARFAREGLRPEGRWARSFETCARSVTAFHAVVGTLPEGAARSWFADIGETLDGELSEALRLARLGESLQPGDTGEPSAMSLKVAELLRAAETSFAETTERAAAIALGLRDDSDFVRVRAQLDMLAEQAPNLRAEGLT